MAQLPVPGDNEGEWGDLLNEFLRVEHNEDGTLKKAADITAAQTTANNAIPTSQKGAANGVASLDSSGKLSTSQTPLPNAPSYSSLTSGATVKAGDLVENSGTVYRRNADGTISGSFNAANWTAVAPTSSSSSISSNTKADGVLGLWLPSRRVKTAPGGTVLDDMSDPTKWTTSTVVQDTAVTFAGRPSLKFTSNASTSLKTFNRSFSTAPIDMTGGYLKLWVRTDDNRDPALTFMNTVDIRVSSDNFATTGAAVDGFFLPDGADRVPVNQANRWFPVTLWPITTAQSPSSTANSGIFGPMSGLSLPNWSAITQLRVVLKGKNSGTGQTVQSFNIWLGQLEKVVTSEFIVSFQFDRAKHPQIDNALSVLGKRGWPATVSSRLDLIEPTVAQDYLTPTEIKELADAYDWDIAIYDYANTIFGDNNYGGSSSTTANTAWTLRTKSDVEDKMLQALSAAKRLFGPKGVHLMQGQSRKLRDDGYDLLRTYFIGANAPNSGQWPQPYPAIDPMRFRSFMWTYSTHWNGGSPGDFEKQIDRAAANKEWIVLLFHDVVAAGTAAGSFDIDTTRLEAICQRIEAFGSANYKVRRTADVLTGNI